MYAFSMTTFTFLLITYLTYHDANTILFIEFRFQKVISSYNGFLNNHYKSIPNFETDSFPSVFKTVINLMQLVSLILFSASLRLMRI